MASYATSGAQIYYGKRDDDVSLLGTIPMVVTMHHHHVLEHWVNSLLKDSQLVHVDAHDDMNGSIPLDENASPIANVNIGNFICPAVHVGIVTDIYWVNPHSVTKRIQEFCLKDDEGSKNFGTTVYQGMLGWDTYAIYDQFKRVRDNIELSPEKPYILDVDLDGFCCDKHLSLDPFETEYFDHDAVNNYEKRIDETISLLDKLSRKPDLITITRSWGGEVSYVPTDKLYAVEQLFLGKLKEIYTK